MLFAQPTWCWDFNGGTSLSFSPKFYGYLDKEDNPDIAHYRATPTGSPATARTTAGCWRPRCDAARRARATPSWTPSYPLRESISARAGGFLHFQLFSGYGESLLDYNRERETQVRVGFSIVR